MSYSETIRERKLRQPFDMFVQFFNGEEPPREIEINTHDYYLDEPLENIEVPDPYVSGPIITTL